jgi:predicted DNA-binding transcriptional regulator AlpA
MEDTIYKGRIWKYSNLFYRENDVLTQIDEIKEHLEGIETKLVSNKEQEDRLITQKEACEILGRDSTTLWRYRKSGILPYLRLAGYGIRYKMSDINNLLKLHSNVC